MPLVYYYQGRPASTWLAAMSRRTRGTAANPADGTTPASQQPATQAAQRSAPARRATALSVDHHSDGESGPHRVEAADHGAVPADTLHLPGR